MIEIINDDMRNINEYIDDNSIDCIVTDPPYELNFMNKGWDNAGISFSKETWEKCFDALKPGGYLLAFGGSRTYHRIACAIEDAGFEIRDTIMWLYGSGFPKSMDISKAIDKRGGNDYSKQFAIDLKKARENRNLTKAYCDEKYCNSSTNWSWYEGRNETQRIPDYETYLKIIEDFTELEKYRELIKEAEREVIGTKKSGCFNANIENYTVGGKESVNVNITAPNTDLAKQWQGWGTCLKPAFEPVIVARKPFKGSLVDNVINNGVGGLNIDECRISHNEKCKVMKKQDEINSIIKQSERYEDTLELKPNGRFPANVILTYDDTDYEEVCGGFPNSKSGVAVRHNSGGNTFGGNNKKPPMEDLGYGDSGSASRYFYCAKASKKDRDEGLEEFEAKQVGSIQGGDTQKKILDDVSSRFRTIKKNIHPTVKPTDLMQYLVRLVAPKGATILDPFMGSGSTGKAIAYENKERGANYSFIGFDLNEEYCDIAKARINFVLKGKGKK